MSSKLLSQFSSESVDILIDSVVLAGITVVIDSQIDGQTDRLLRSNRPIYS